MNRPVPPTGPTLISVLGLSAPDPVPTEAPKPDLLRCSLVRVGSCVVKSASTVPVAEGVRPKPALLTRSFIAKAHDYAANRAWLAGSGPDPREQLSSVLPPALDAASSRNLERRLDKVLGSKRAKGEWAKRARAQERQAKFVRKLRASAGEKTILEEIPMSNQAAQDYERRRDPSGGSCSVCTLCLPKFVFLPHPASHPPLLFEGEAARRASLEALLGAGFLSFTVLACRSMLRPFTRRGLRFARLR